MPTAVMLRSRAFDRFALTFSYRAATPLMWVNVGCVAAIVALTVRLTSVDRLRRLGPFLIGLVCTAAIYVGVLAFGRPPQDLLGATYYPYPFGLLTIVALYAVIDPTRFTGAASAACLAAWLLFGTLHAVRTAGAATDIEAANRYPSRYLALIEAFVDDHKHEPDFTFAIERHPRALDPAVDLVRGYPDRPDAVESRRATEILFEPYYRAQGPKYLLDASAQQVVLRSGVP
jgi:hypothetical protein